MMFEMSWCIKPELHRYLIHFPRSLLKASTLKTHLWKPLQAIRFYLQSATQDAILLPQLKLYGGISVQF